MKEEAKKHKTATLAVAVITIILIGACVAVTIIPAPEHVINTPIDPTPAPTATPTATPTELHLTSNNTDPFYKGDWLRMTGTLTPAQAGITVNLYNNGNFITSEQTDANGQAVFDRQPYNPFDYTITAEIS